MVLRKMEGKVRGGEVSQYTLTGNRFKGTGTLKQKKVVPATVLANQFSMKAPSRPGFKVRMRSELIILYSVLRTVYGLLCRFF